LPENVFSNYELAKKHILPEETHLMRVRAMIDDYLKKHVLVEIIYFFKRDTIHFEENFKEFSQKMKNSFNHPEVVWNCFK
jgi:hypothetical protein